MATVIIFGLEVTGGITLSIFGATGQNMPPMTVTPEGAKAEEYAYQPRTQRWETFLAKGRYVVRIEELVNPLTEGAIPVDGAVAALTKLHDGSTIFISRGKEVNGTWPLIAWTATSAGSDPKNPWPPPSDAALAHDVKWFEAELAKQPAPVKRDRSA